MSEPARAPDSSADFLAVARVLRAHGTSGEMVCEIITEFPKRFRQTPRLYFSEPGHDTAPPVPRDVERVRIASRRNVAQLILKVAGVDDRDAAEALRGAILQVPESEAWRLPRGRFYWHQIVGLRVETRDGRELGTVKEILETGANDVYVIARERGELLIPAIKSVVKEIAPDRGVMIVELLPGMEA